MYNVHCTLFNVNMYIIYNTPFITVSYYKYSHTHTHAHTHKYIYTIVMLIPWYFGT